MIFIAAPPYRAWGCLKKSVAFSTSPIVYDLKIRAGNGINRYRVIDMGCLGMGMSQKVGYFFDIPVSLKLSLYTIMT